MATEAQIAAFNKRLDARLADIPEGHKRSTFAQLETKEQKGILTPRETKKLELARDLRFRKAVEEQSSEEATFLRSAKDRDVPLHNVSPIGDWLTRAGGELRSANLPAQVRYYKRKFPELKMRIAEDKLIFRIPHPETGEEADFPVDPVGFDPGDIADIAAYLPSLFVQIGLLNTPGLREATLLKLAGTEALAGLTTNTVMDTLAGWVDEALSDMSLQQIANETDGLEFQGEFAVVADNLKQRLGEGAIDLITPIALGVGKLGKDAIMSGAEKGVRKTVEFARDFLGVGRDEEIKATMASAGRIDQFLARGSPEDHIPKIDLAFNKRGLTKFNQRVKELRKEGKLRQESAQIARKEINEAHGKESKAGRDGFFQKNEQGEYIPDVHRGTKSAIPLHDYLPETVAPWFRKFAEFMETYSGGGELAKRKKLGEELTSGLQELLGATGKFNPKTGGFEGANPSEISDDLYKELRAELDKNISKANKLRAEGTKITKGEIDSAWEIFGSQARKLLTDRQQRSVVGDGFRRSYKDKWTRFFDKATKIYKPAEAASKGKAVVSSEGVVAKYDELIESLQGAEKGKAANEAAQKLLAQKQKYLEKVEESPAIGGIILTDDIGGFGGSPQNREAPKWLTIKEARNERTRIAKSIDDTLGRTDQSEYVKKQLERALTEEIEAASARLDGDAGELLDKANKFYREGDGEEFFGIDAFRSFGIGELGIPKTARNFYVDDDAYVKQILDHTSIGRINVGRWKEVKKFFGKDSKEFTDLRRAAIDTILNDGGKLGDNLSSPAKVAETIGMLDKEVADDLVPNREKLMKKLTTLEWLKNKEIPKEKIWEALAEPEDNLAIAHLRAAVAIEEKVGKAAKTQLLSALRSDTVAEGTFASTTLVKRVLTHSSPREVDELLSLTTPEQKKKLRTGIIRQIYEEVTEGSPTQFSAKFKNNKNALTNINAGNFQGMLSGGVSEGTIRKIVGDETLLLMRDHLKFILTKGVKESSDATAGGMAVGPVFQSVIGAVFAPAIAAGKALRNVASRGISHVLAADRTVRILSSYGPEQVKMPMTPASLKTWVTSSVFANDFMAEFQDMDERDQRHALGYLHIMQRKATEAAAAVKGREPNTIR